MAPTSFLESSGKCERRLGICMPPIGVSLRSAMADCISSSQIRPAYLLWRHWRHSDPSDCVNGPASWLKRCDNSAIHTPANEHIGSSCWPEAAAERVISENPSPAWTIGFMHGCTRSRIGGSGQLIAMRGLAAEFVSVNQSPERLACAFRPNSSQTIEHSKNGFRTGWCKLLAPSSAELITQHASSKWFRFSIATQESKIGCHETAR